MTQEKRTALSKSLASDRLAKFISEREPLEADQSIFDRLAQAMAWPEEKPPKDDQT